MQRKRLLIILVIMCFGFCVSSVQAALTIVNRQDYQQLKELQAKQQKPKYILFVIDRVTWHDYLHVMTPAWKQVIAEGAIGMMSARTGGLPENGGYLTIGGGTRMIGSSVEGDIASVEGNAFAPQEQTAFGRVKYVYPWLAGVSMENAALFHLGLAKIQQENSKLNYQIIPGLLGESLRAKGLMTAGIGNADLPGKRFRPVAAIVMDSHGRVPFGFVGPLPRKNAAIGAWHTDPKVLLAGFDAVLPKADLVAVDFGDTTRLALNADTIQQGALHKRRLATLRAADIFLAGVIKRMKDTDWRLMIVTPHLQDERQKSSCRVAPIILYGAGINPGLVTSPSTRTPGMVVNTDIAPTILDYFHIPLPAPMVGRPIFTTSETQGQDSISWLRTQLDRLTTVEQQRPILLRPATIIIVIIFAACIIALLLHKKAPAPARMTLRALCLAVLAWPIVMILFGVWLPKDPIIAWGATVLSIGVLAAIASLLTKHSVAGMSLLSVITFLLLVVDVVFLHQTLLHASPLSYSPAEGARYYGIGNELGGVLLGAVLFAFPDIWFGAARWQQFLRWPLMAAVVIFFGQSSLGANFGMALAAVAAFSTIGVLVLKRRPLRAVMWIVLLLMVLVAMVVFESQQKAAPSHIGVAAVQLSRANDSSLPDLIVRKLEMNWRLLRYSLWAEVLIASLLLVSIPAFKLQKPFDDAIQRLPGLHIAMTASFIGAIAAFLCNDSGTLAAALCLLYPAAATAYMALGEERTLNSMKEAL